MDATYTALLYYSCSLTQCMMLAESSSAAKVGLLSSSNPFCLPMQNMMNFGNSSSCMKQSHYICGWLSQAVALLQGFVVLHSCGLVHADFKTDNAKAMVIDGGLQVHLELLDLSSACPHGAGKFCRPLLIHTTLHHDVKFNLTIVQTTSALLT